MERRTPTVGADRFALDEAAWHLAEATSADGNLLQHERAIHRYLVGLQREQKRRGSIKFRIGERGRKLDSLDRAVDSVLQLASEEDLDVASLIDAVVVEARCRDDFLFGPGVSEYLKGVSRAIDSKDTQRVFADAVRRGDIQLSGGRLNSRSASQQRVAAWGIVALTVMLMLVATLARAPLADLPWTTIALHVAGSMALGYWLASSQFDRARKLRRAILEASKAAKVKPSR